MVALAVAGAAAGIAEQFLRARYERAMHKGTLLSGDSRRGRSIVVRGPLNYLLLGSDARPDEPTPGQRSDTIIVVHVSENLDRAYLVSIPRDLRVYVPAVPGSGFSGGLEKINSAFARGSENGDIQEGFRVLSATMTRLTGLKFDGAAIIDFNGFQKVVQVLGGVELCVDAPTRSIHTGAYYQPGCQHLRAWQALDYLRQRYDQPNGDYDRQRHQQQFLKAILRQAEQQGVATDPVKLDALLRAVGGSLTVDTNGIPVDRLAFALRGVKPSSLVGVRVPSHPEMIDEESYIVPDDDARTLYRALRADSLGTWTKDNPEWVNTL